MDDLGECRGGWRRLGSTSDTRMLRVGTVARTERWEANLELFEPMKTYQRMRERLEGCIQLVTLSLHDYHVHKNDHLGAEDAFRYTLDEHNTGEMVITREAQNALYLKNLQISGEEI